ncbi:MAG: hypothetical protein KME30_29025 [Iphinoe sp. HA4291-MV1]|jgi:hypothetical protein|nr:hypothetical protein [Iphinoe sp. HA4291-MV1]
MNNQEFNAFTELMGINPSQDSDSSENKPHPSANYYDAPTYRGENHADLTDDEREAESAHRSEVDQIKSLSNLSEAMMFIGTSTGINLVLDAYSNPYFGLGVNLVGFLVFATGAGSKSGKSNIVRAGSMAVSSAFELGAVVRTANQSTRITEINTSIEQFVIPKQNSNDNSMWLCVLLVAGIIGFWIFNLKSQPKAKPQTPF